VRRRGEENPYDRVGFKTAEDRRGEAAIGKDMTG
jgi:hypothetical protein